MTDLARARELVKELSEVLGEAEAPEPVTIIGTEYEPSEDPAHKPGAYEITVLSTGQRLRRFLPRASFGDPIPEEELHERPAN